MSAEAFQAVVRLLPDLAIIDLRGEINSAAESVVNAASNQAAAANPSAILLNFERVEYINSTGIALIVSILSQARAANRRLLACGLSEHYVEIFQITRLADYMTIYPDEQSVLVAEHGAET
jgi:anti-sigma B factor antagonist